MASSPLPWPLLEQYLAGELPAVEAAAVDATLAEWPVERETVQAYRAAVRDVAPRPDHTAVGRSLERLHHALDATSASGLRRTEAVGAGRPRGWRVAAWGAVLCSVAIAAFALRNVMRHSVAERDNSLEHGGQKYTTAAGQRALVTLSDGSRATLGPATTLVVSTDPSTRTVTARVEGQVVFTVAHDPTRPFVVQTRGSLTRVLGTTFLVRQYAADARARVVVLDGRVSLEALSGGTDDDDRLTARLTARRPIVLAANMIGTTADSGRANATRDGDARDYLAWTSGQLVFRQTPLKDVAADLARVYDVEIRLGDPAFAARLVTWKIQTARYPVSQAIDELATLLRARAEQSGSVITLVPGRRSPVHAAPSRSSHPLEPQYGR